MKYVFAAIVASIISACAGPKGDTGAIGPMATPTPTSSTQADINSIVSDENTYRESLGQTELSEGLSCSVQQVSGGQWLSSSSPGYNSTQGVLTLVGTSYSYLYQGNFDQPNTASGINNILPTEIAPLFTNLNYKINCSGQLVVTATDYYNFDLNSDDGSILTIDGTQVVNNDGNHSITDKSGVKLLRRGVHTFNLLYAQSGAGNFALIFKANGSLIDPMYYYH